MLLIKIKKKNLVKKNNKKYIIKINIYKNIYLYIFYSTFINSSSSI